VTTASPRARPFRFQPRIAVTLVHLALLAAVLALFMGRKPGLFRSTTILELSPAFYTHVSNFSLSYVLYAGIGFLWLIIGVPLRFLVLAGLVLIAANLVYELFLPVLNTRDPVDAVYGIAGTLLALLWLVVVRRFGLVPLPGPATEG
jgi:hypothetical protein